MLEKLPNYIRPTLFFSIILGVIFGILLVVPIVQLFMLFAFWIMGGLIVFLLKKNNFIGQFTQKEAIIIGCVSGMISVFSAAIIFLPLSALIGAIFNTASIAFLFTTSFMSSVFSFFVMLMLIFFIGMMNIIFNIASALGMIFILNNLKIQEQNTNEFKIEIDK